MSPVGWDDLEDLERRHQSKRRMYKDRDWREDELKRSERELQRAEMGDMEDD